MQRSEQFFVEGVRQRLPRQRHFTGKIQCGELLNFFWLDGDLELCNPTALPVDGENLIGQNLEHPGAETGVIVVAIERTKGAQHRVLQRVFEIAPIKDHAARIVFQIALDWPQEC